MSGIKAFGHQKSCEVEIDQFSVGDIQLGN